MRNDEIERLSITGKWKGRPLHGSLVETHASWVVLTGDLAFKIKKPVTFSFLDFSTLDKRKYFCEREVELNKRLTDIYLGVVPVFKEGDYFFLGGDRPDPVEFAVQMKRMDSRLEMDRMLAKGLVGEGHMEKLASLVSGFHAGATVIYNPFDHEGLRENFNDIGSVRQKIVRNLGPEYGKIIEEAVLFSNRFLNENREFFNTRVKQGFIRDLHGDFHSGNVFLTEEPVIFDCIEFNDAMRQVDILDEVAFFCMDLEAYGFKELALIFSKLYQSGMGLDLSGKETGLFNYYKLYRANVRAKVHALKDKFNASEVSRYLRLMSSLLQFS